MKINFIKNFQQKVIQHITFGRDIPLIYENIFGKNIPFWTDGYFACSVGNVSEEMLKKYIENQG